MMNVRKSEINHLLLLGLLIATFALAMINVTMDTVQASAPLDPICDRYDLTDPNTQAPEVCRQDTQTRSQTVSDNVIFSFLREVVNILTLALTIVGVIGVIVGGFMYVISAGEAQKIQTARKAVLYSVVGVAVGVLSQTILRFVLGAI